MRMVTTEKTDAAAQNVVSDLYSKASDWDAAKHVLPEVAGVMHHHYLSRAKAAEYQLECERRHR